MPKLFVFVSITVLISGCDKLDASGASSAAARAPATAKAPIPPPVLDRVSITVNDEGYAPAEVHGTKDRSLTLEFTRTSESSCGEEVVFPELDVRESLPINEPVEITIVPKRTGRLAFTCGMNMMKGALIIH